MDIEFGPDKDAVNQAKHGLPFEFGAIVRENRIGETVDNRRDYGETRVNAFGLFEGRLFVCTYTMRDGAHRLISVRKASRQEQRIWLS
ncbi:MAG: BrnT family toxin [Acetobacteraceae bacterium]